MIRFSPGCGCCDTPCDEWCELCSCDSPDRFKITPSGVIETFYDCCEDYNAASVFVDRASETSTLCIWDTTETGVCSFHTANFWQVRLTPSGSDVVLEVRLHQISSGGSPDVNNLVLWSTTLTGPVDCCLDLADLVVPFVSQGASVACDWTESTVAVDAICGECGCSTGTLPTEYTVTLAGFDDDACNYCATMNDTFVLTYDADCTFRYSRTSDCSATDELDELSLSLAAISGGVRLTVTLSIADGAQVIVWQTDITGGGCDVSGLSVPHSQTTGSNYCDASSATCTVTAT